MLYVFFLKQLYFYKQYPQWADSSTQFSSFDPYDHERQAELQARKIRLTGGKNKCLALGLLTSVWLCWDLNWIFYIMVELPARPCMGGKEQGQAKRTGEILLLWIRHIVDLGFVCTETFAIFTCLLPFAPPYPDLPTLHFSYLIT